MRTFYAKAMKSATDSPMRFDSGQPYNFHVVGFTSKSLRDECTEYVFSECGGNLIRTTRKNLVFSDLPCPVFSSLIAFKQAWIHRFDADAMVTAHSESETQIPGLLEAIRQCLTGYKYTVL